MINYFQNASINKAEKIQFTRKGKIIKKTYENHTSISPPISKKKTNTFKKRILMYLFYNLFRTMTARGKDGQKISLSGLF